jgi:hypothetical protein
MEKQPLQPSSFVARDESLLTTASDEGITMIGDSQSEVYHLDAVGLRIWSLLEDPCSVSAVCQALQEEFSVDPETCERDVIAFLEQLRDKGLIQIVPEPPSARPA